MKLFRDKCIKHCCEIGLDNEIIIEWIGFYHFTLFIPLLLAQILLGTSGSDIRGEISLIIILQLSGKINGQKRFTGKNLRPGTLEMMVNHLHFIKFSV